MNPQIVRGLILYGPLFLEWLRQNAPKKRRKKGKRRGK